MTWTVECADVLDWAAGYEGPPAHALLCDPPYELSFMGRKWDSTGIAFQAETWAALAEHLLPGAFGMAFASARGWHRLAVAIEDAGLIFHPSIFLLGWVQGSGFPKATRIGKNGDHPDFEGHRYGLQSLKPTLEPILVFQKPYAGKPVDSIVATGAGSLWIDGGRIKNAGDMDDWPEELQPFKPSGRWPANVLLQHLPGCQRRGTRRVKASGGLNPIETGVSIGTFEEKQHRPFFNYAGPDGTEEVDDWLCQPGCPVAALAAQSGERRNGGKPGNTYEYDYDTDRVAYGAWKNRQMNKVYEDHTGTAARFFFQATWEYELAERLAGVEPFYYCAKSSRRERDAGLEHLPKKSKGNGNKWTDQDSRTHDRNNQINAPVRNHHPCCKPLSLVRYLATLLLPPPAYAPRRCLCPFLGSGSEAIGAGLAGFEEVVGVEMERDYCDIAEARLAHWLDKVQLELSL